MDQLTFGDIEPGSIPQPTNDYRRNVAKYFCSFMCMDMGEERVREIVSEYREWITDPNDFDPDFLSYLVDDMCDILNEIAPDGLFFGTHPDDGSDWGWWAVDDGEQWGDDGA
jgi:hypothetical protein